jgi:hypothetical protein
LLQYCKDHKERIKELEAENRRLFDAHSVEMVRADKLKQEVERLQSIVETLTMPTNDEWMKEWLDDDE